MWQQLCNSHQCLMIVESPATQCFLKGLSLARVCPSLFLINWLSTILRQVPRIGATVTAAFYGESVETWTLGLKKVVEDDSDKKFVAVAVLLLKGVNPCCIECDIM